MAVFLEFFVLSLVACGGAGRSLLEVGERTPLAGLIGGNASLLLEYYTPWCGHCAELEPELEAVARAFDSSRGHVRVARINADANRELARAHGILAFPMFAWFPAASTTPEEYDGELTADAMVAFINDRTGLRRGLRRTQRAVRALTPRTFESVAADASTAVLVVFTAAWCTHCEVIAPHLELAAQSFAGEPTVVVASVDAAAHPDLASQYGVEGFPAFRFFDATEEGGTPAPYTGERTAAGFVRFLNRHARARGVHERALGGALAARAGRGAELDRLAVEFMRALVASPPPALNGAAAAALRQIEHSAAGGRHDATGGEDAAEGGAAPRPDLYLSCARWLLAHPPAAGAAAAEPLLTELKRLGRVLESDAVSAARKTVLMLRHRVLTAFAEEVALGSGAEKTSAAARKAEKTEL